MAVNNEDYFYSKSQQDLLNLSKKEVYQNLDDFNSLITKLNSAFGNECIRFVHADSAKYVKLGCKYKGCVYQHWYNF